MMKLNRDNWLSGLQWFFFLFCNTIVIPPTLQSAFHLSNETTFTITQYAFLLTALACLLQIFMGHKRSIMEGPTGLWWGVILSVTLAESSRGTSLEVIGNSFVIGIALAGVLTIFIGLSGLGKYLAKLFTPAVMVVFMFLLGAQLISIFLKGMLGLPFGVGQAEVSINYSTFALAVAIMLLIIGMIIFLPSSIGKYALLIGSLVGWGVFALIFHSTSATLHTTPTWQLFPWGKADTVNYGIITTCLIAGLLNTSNTFGAIRGTDVFYPTHSKDDHIFKRSFITSGLVTLVCSPLGVVPYSPFVSSIGLITQTKDTSKRSFTLGCIILLLIGLLPIFTRLFASFPLIISSAVMLVSYLPLLWSSLTFTHGMVLNARNIYRIALPLFFGIFLMGLAPHYLQDIPIIIRPLLSNGLLMGVVLAIILEKLISWDKIQ